jgi:hypothetical protein
MSNGVGAKPPEPNMSVGPNMSVPPPNMSAAPPNASTMEHAGVAPNSSPQSQAAPQCERRVVPSLRIARFECTQGHGLGGLFVLFRPVPSKLWQVTKKQMGLAPDPPFQLGVVGRSGFLGPPELNEETLTFLGGLEYASHPEGDPDLVSCAHELLPDSYRVLVGQKYELYLIQHPDIGYAREVLQFINEGEKKKYGEPRTLAPDGEGVFVIPEDPKAFLPGGDAEYGGWYLFRSMASGQCQPVRQQVAKLQAQLGALRYIVGNSIWPYLPDFNLEDDHSGGDNAGVFDVRVMNAVYSFQRDALGGAVPFKVKEPKPQDAFFAAPASFTPQPEGLLKARAPGLKATAPEHSWAYLERSDKPPAAPVRPDQANGTVDPSTSRALKHWLQEGLRKPGAILVKVLDPRGWGLWMRPEAAYGWFAWNQIVRALGFDAGICMNHTYRSAQVDIGHAGYGRAARSIHKTGLAMDLGLMGDFKSSVESWPVAYVREPTADRIRWRLYGPVAHQVPAAGAGDAAEAAKELGAELAQRLQEALSSQASHVLVRTDPAKLLQTAVQQLVQQIQTDPLAFFARYYKHEIALWDYDAYHPEGGRPKQVVGADGSPKEEASATEFYRDHQSMHIRAAISKLDEKLAAPKLAAATRARLEKELEKKNGQLESMQGADSPASQKKAFLDLTALGELVHMERISAFRAGWQQVTKQLGAGKLGDVAKALAAAKAWGQRDVSGDSVLITRKKRVIEGLTVARIDDTFMAGWNTLLQAVRKELARSVKVSVPQITITLTWGKGNKADDAPKVAGKLRQFADKKFYSVLELEGVPRLQTGAEWATYIEGVPAALEQQAAVTEAKKAAEVQEAEKTDKKKAKRIASAPPKIEKLMLTLQPIFDLAFSAAETTALEDFLTLLPNDVVNLPAPGQPIGMEWWHFQRSDLLGSGKSRRKWGDLLEEIGWKREALIDTPSRVLFLRPGVGYPPSELEELAY